MQSATIGLIQPSYQVSVDVGDTFDKIFSLNAFPNPSIGWLQIETDFKDFDNITVSDRNGKIVLKEHFHYSLIDLSLLPKGFYILQLSSQQGISKNIKIEIL